MKYGCGNTPNLGDEVRYRWYADEKRPRRFSQESTAIVCGLSITSGVDAVAFSHSEIYPASWFALVSRLADRPLTTSPVLFLDIDGVLNGHEAYATGYSGIRRDCVSVLNKVILAVPDLKLVISSAWRYMILQGEMTLKGFEYMLLINGVLAHGRVAGHTEADGPLEDEPPHTDRARWSSIGLDMRAKQILKFVETHRISRWAAVDDLNLADLPNFVRTNGEAGIQLIDAEKIILLLSPVAD